MSRAVLLIMAAGMGSRFGGGMKQLEPVGPSGEIIMDYSVHDALRAGFDKVIFVIRKDFEKEFREGVGRRISKLTDVEYAFQETWDIPEAYKGKFPLRAKPWGTGQAVLCCRDLIDSPFMVINADDYYGAGAFKSGYEYLLGGRGKKRGDEICMVGFVLGNTLSDNGAVTRGLCEADAEGMLTKIVETRSIIKTEDGAGALRGDGSIQSIDAGSLVSMNMWGLFPDFIDVLDKGFADFLEKLPKGDLSCEYLLPTFIGGLLEDSKISVKVLKSSDRWFGMTYRKDRESVAAALRDLINTGVYPKNLYDIDI